MSDVPPPPLRLGSVEARVRRDRRQHLERELVQLGRELFKHNDFSVGVSKFCGSECVAVRSCLHVLADLRQRQFLHASESERKSLTVRHISGMDSRLQPLAPRGSRGDRLKQLVSVCGQL
jgi:hypothetical protein